MGTRLYVLTLKPLSIQNHRWFLSKNLDSYQMYSKRSILGLDTLFPFNKVAYVSKWNLFIQKFLTKLENHDVSCGASQLSTVLWSAEYRTTPHLWLVATRLSKPHRYRKIARSAAAFMLPCLTLIGAVPHQFFELAQIRLL